jgi:hypothetical protein
MYNTFNSIAGPVRDDCNDAAVSMIVGSVSFCVAPWRIPTDRR